MKALLALFVFLAVPLLAQNEWLRATKGSSVGAEYLHPSFVNDSNSKVFGSVLLLSGRFAVSDATYLTVEVPFVRSTSEFSYSYFDGMSYVQISSKESESAVANVALGVEMGSAENHGSGFVRLRIPTFPKDKGLAGLAALFGDFPHLERYGSEMLVLSAGYRYHPVLGNGVKFSLAASPSVWVPTSDDGNNETEALLDYAIGLGYDGELLKLGVGFGGKMIVTEEYIFFDKKAVHYLQGEVGVKIGSLEPSVSITRMMESEFTERLRFTLGLSLRFLF